MQGKINPRRPIDSYTKLLCHFNGADAQTNIIAATGQVLTPAGSAQLDTAQKKFGTASLLLDGNSDYVSVPDSADWDFGTGDFTIDFWVRFNAIDNGVYLFCEQYQDGSNYWACYINSYRLTMVFFNGAVVKGSYSASQNWVPSTGVWYHIALERNGTSAKMFVDGVSISLTEDTAFGTNNVGTLSGSLYIGARSTAFYINGWMDEFRISKGIARWTSNFSVPTALYPDVESSVINFPGFQKIADFIATGNESSFSVDVDGDTDKEYYIYGMNLSQICDVTLNKDSGSNYPYKYVFNNAGTLSTAGDVTGCVVGVTANSIFSINLICRPGILKMSFSHAANYTSGTTINTGTVYASSWNNTANITSITFTGRSGNFGSGTRISVYARRSN